MSESKQLVTIQNGSYIRRNAHIFLLNLVDKSRKMI